MERLILAILAAAAGFDQARGGEDRPRLPFFISIAELSEHQHQPARPRKGRAFGGRRT